MEYSNLKMTNFACKSFRGAEKSDACVITKFSSGSHWIALKG